MRKAVIDENPSELPTCYGFPNDSPNSHPECSKCKIREICLTAKELPMLSDEDYDAIVNKIETCSSEKDATPFHCPRSLDFTFFDDMNKERKYSHDEILDLLGYFFGLSTTEFFFIQCKLFSPEMSFQDIANARHTTRQNISQQFKKILRRRPELFSMLRIRRQANTPKPEDVDRKAV